MDHDRHRIIHVFHQTGDLVGAVGPVSSGFVDGIEYQAVVGTYQRVTILSPITEKTVGDTAL